jgi:hypothetical protein
VGVGRWVGGTVHSHAGSTVGQSALLVALDGHDLAVAVAVNSDEAAEPAFKLLETIIADLSGVTVPPGPIPPAVPTGVDLSRYSGVYTGPISEFHVTVADGGLDIEYCPLAEALALGDKPRRHKVVHLRDDYVVAVDRDGSEHAVYSFPLDGAYLHAGRAYRRETA